MCHSFDKWQCRVGGEGRREGGKEREREREYSFALDAGNILRGMGYIIGPIEKIINITLIHHSEKLYSYQYKSSAYWFSMFSINLYTKHKT